MTLIGRWVIISTDSHALEIFGDVLLNFEEGGNLTYITRSDDKQQIMRMRYEVDGRTIITDQPSAPRVERTPFSFSENGLLTLLFGGEAVTFRRAYA